MVEMLVVIAIIGLLAGLILSAFPSIIRVANTKKVVASFTQINTSIQDYFATYNSYPLDNPTNSQVNPLYYELQGSTWNAGGAKYDLVGESISELNVRNFFNQDGLRNVTHDPNDASAPKAKAFLTGLSPTAYISVTNSVGVDVRLLRVPVKDTDTNMIFALNGDLVNVWKYATGTNAIYNKGKYDLWCEFESGGTRYRVSNWDKEPVRIEDSRK